MKKVKELRCHKDKNIYPRHSFDEILTEVLGADNPMVAYVRNNYHCTFGKLKAAEPSPKRKTFGLYLGQDSQGEMLALYDFGVCRTSDSGLFNYDYKPGDLIAFRKSIADELTGEVVGTDAEIVDPGHFKGV